MSGRAARRRHRGFLARRAGRRRGVRAPFVRKTPIDWPHIARFFPKYPIFGEKTNSPGRRNDRTFAAEMKRGRPGTPAAVPSFFTPLYYISLTNTSLPYQSADVSVPSFSASRRRDSGRMAEESPLTFSPLLSLLPVVGIAGGWQRNGEHSFLILCDTSFSSSAPCRPLWP